MKLFGKKKNGEEKEMGYDLEGRMQEICTCKTLCPCWVGVDPDGGKCDFEWIFHFDRGQINGVDVAGINMGFHGHLPGNIFDGNVRLAVIVDDRASEAQQEALLAAFTGKVGGPLADLAGLVGEVTGVDRAPIEFDVNKGSGRFRAGDAFEGEVEGYRSLNGTPTTLNDAAVAPVLGSPAYPAKVLRYQMFGKEVTPGGATQSEFHYVTA
jgi:hypothetical protein